MALFRTELHGRARRNALASLTAMRRRRADAVEAQDAVDVAAQRDAEPGPDVRGVVAPPTL